LRVAIGEQLKRCPQVITLGVRAQMADYTRYERKLLRAAEIVFYPTARFSDLFATLGKKTFPSSNCYRLAGDRLKQTALLRLLDVPHPRTRVYYGQRQKKEILKDFVLPLVAKSPFGSSKIGRGFIITDPEELEWYNQQFNPAYIQEYLDAEQELRVFVLNYNTIFVYSRKAASSISTADSQCPGLWRMDKVPDDAGSMAKQIAWNAGLSDVALDMIYDGSRYWVLEFIFQNGDQSWPQAENDRFETIMQMIERGEL
jgi:ribosomal protein S6--L-glutamate ligase